MYLASQMIPPETPHIFADSRDCSSMQKYGGGAGGIILTPDTLLVRTFHHIANVPSQSCQDQLFCSVSNIETPFPEDECQQTTTFLRLFYVLSHSLLKS